MVNRILHKDDLPAFAVELAAMLKTGDALLLYGDLGAGKTALSRALIQALANDGTLDVASPTFPICLTYDTPRGQIWHYDLYRLEEGADLTELDWDAARDEGITIVEWPDRAAERHLTKPLYKLSIQPAQDDLTREISLEAVL